ncbi:unnamed protein product [Rotaria sp. Silwood2]|nr:unnamed protein product [Rotaria sp. Silwood2]
MVWITIDPMSPLDIARRVVLGTELEHLEHAPGRIWEGFDKAYHTIDDTTRDKFPFLPAPINSLQQIKSSTIEQIQTQAEQTHYA